MSRFRLIITFVLSLAFAISCCSIALCKDKAEYDPHAILVKFKPKTISSASIKNLNTKFKVKKSKKIFKDAEEGVNHTWNKRGKLVKIKDLSGYYKIYFPDEIDVLEALAEYASDPNIESAGLDYRAYANAIPSDTSFGLQWALSNEGQSGGTVDADIDAPEAWDVHRGTSEVIIAVIDSGVDTDHPDLSSKLLILPGCNFVEGGDDPNPVPDGIDNNFFNGPDDGCSHGTHVSGIAAAITDNPIAIDGKSIAGVGWNCRIMPIKVLDDEGTGWLSDIVAGIEFAADNGADVINMSLGFPGYIEGFGLQDAIDNAYALGCVIVAGAGNDFTFISEANKISPLCNDGGSNMILGVAGTDHDDKKAWYSNYSSTYVDVSAPGGSANGSILGIYSTVYNNPTYGFNNWYDYFQGTSMATPFVSGLAALVKSQNPGWDNWQITQLIMGTTDYIDDKNTTPIDYSGTLGTGRINAYGALTGSVAWLKAKINSPRQSDVVYGLVDILGTATWEGAGFYRVYTAEGSSPLDGDFIELAYSTSKHINELLAQWDTTGLNGVYSIRLRVNDLATVESEIVVNVGVTPNRVSVLGNSLGGPNPFNPGVDSKYVIHYNLTSNADARVMIYDMNQTLLWQRRYLAGQNGGRQGDNKAEWDGRSNLGGHLSTGVYFYQIVSRNTVIGRGKIIIFR
jgi:subtilisin family serine protease